MKEKSKGKMKERKEQENGKSKKDKEIKKQNPLFVGKFSRRFG